MFNDFIYINDTYLEASVCVAINAKQATLFLIPWFLDRPKHMETFPLWRLMNPKYDKLRRNTTY